MSLAHVDPHVSEIVMVWIQSGDLLMVWIQISLLTYALRPRVLYVREFRITLIQSCVCMYMCVFFLCVSLCLVSLV
jgi:hypothetical protein